jgi:hypothetical protein
LRGSERHLATVSGGILEDSLQNSLVRFAGKHKNMLQITAKIPLKSKRTELSAEVNVPTHFKIPRRESAKLQLYHILRTLFRLRFL